MRCGLPRYLLSLHCHSLLESFITLCQVIGITTIILGRSPCQLIVLPAPLAGRWSTKGRYSRLFILQPLNLSAFRPSTFHIHPTFAPFSSDTFYTFTTHYNNSKAMSLFAISIPQELVAGQPPTAAVLVQRPSTILCLTRSGMRYGLFLSFPLDMSLADDL